MYDKNNIFAKIIRAEIPADKLYEDEHIIAVRDINPEAEVHILVIPKGAYTDFTDFILHAAPKLVTHYFQTIAKIAGENTNGDYRLITNKGKSAGQSVFHFHTHILGSL